MKWTVTVTQKHEFIDNIVLHFDSDEEMLAFVKLTKEHCKNCTIDIETTNIVEQGE